jgi:PAS domain S-box-containing protein/putative nucleotidyltransferase with HDIG domain
MGNDKSGPTAPADPPERELKTEEGGAYLRLTDQSLADEMSAEFEVDGDLRSVLDSLPYPLMLVDEAHNIVLTNRAAAAFTGKTAMELEGTYCPRSIHGTDDPIAYCPLEESVSTGTACEKTVFLAEHNIWIETGIYPTAYESDTGKRVYVHTVKDISERERSKQDLERQSRVRATLYDLMRLSLSDDSRENILGAFLDRLFDIPWLALERKGAIFLADGPHRLKLAAERNLATSLLETCQFIVPGRCMCGRAFESGETVFANAMDERHDVRFEGMADHGHYCVPMISNNQVVGILNLYLPLGHEYSVDEVAFLESVADLLAGFTARVTAKMEREQALAEVRQTLRATVTAIGRLLEARDPYTAGHQQRVADVADLIAKHLGWPEDARRPLRLAARLHDVGKIIVPAEILAKPGRLSAPEFAVIKMHAEVGYSILQDISFPWPIADIVHQHHEKLDGSGYPKGLTGADIQIEARILCVADVLEAVASLRPYRAGLGVGKAIEILQEGQGTLFDALAVTAAAELHETGALSFLE